VSLGGRLCGVAAAPAICFVLLSLALATSCLLGTVIALPAVWYFTEAGYAAPGLIA
jgi:hypothetical protein